MIGALTEYLKMTARPGALLSTDALSVDVVSVDTMPTAPAAIEYTASPVIIGDVV